MAKKRDQIGPMETWRPTQKVKPQSKTKTTIVFDNDDQKEIRRIEDALRAKGFRVTEKTQLVRIALRVAFAHKTDAAVQDIVEELAKQWKRGG